MEIIRDLILGLLSASAIVIVGYWQFGRKPKTGKQNTASQRELRANMSKMPNSVLSELAASSLEYLQEMLIEERKTNLYLRKTLEALQKEYGEAKEEITALRGQLEYRDNRITELISVVADYRAQLQQKGIG